MYWLTSAIWHAVVIFYVPMIAFMKNDGSANESGMWALGVMTYSGAVFVVNLKLAMRTRYWTWVTHFLTWGSMVVFLLYLLYLSGMWKNMELFPELAGITNFISRPTFWLTMLLVAGLSLVLDLGMDTVHRFFLPNLQHLFQHLEHMSGEKHVSSLASTPSQTPRQSRSNSFVLQPGETIASLPSVMQVISQ